MASGSTVGASDWGSPAHEFSVPSGPAAAEPDGVGQVRRASAIPPQVEQEVWNACMIDLFGDVFDTGGPGRVVAVLGDSSGVQLRLPALADRRNRWLMAAHCGENFGSAVHSGRVRRVVESRPHAAVLLFGTNSASTFWTPRPDLLDAAAESFRSLIDATDSVPCRVLFTVPVRPPGRSVDEDAEGWTTVQRTINRWITSIDAAHHPGVLVIDWDAITRAEPSLLLDDAHMTQAGITRRFTLIHDAVNRCPTPPPV